MDSQAASSPPNILGLSFFPQQWRAVSAPIGAHLVLAGPGAGKTRCLTGRIGYLLTRLQAQAASVCAITFTNKAAQEIQQRLRQWLGDLVEPMKLGTIHSLCLDILRKHGRRVGLPSNFSVAGAEHQKLVLSKLGVVSKAHSGLLIRFGSHRLQGEKLSDQDNEIYKKYHRELRGSHLIDYDEILQLTRILLESNPAILEECQELWRHLLIDEFQDLDHTQYSILKLLAWKHRSLFAVGDDEQSIFSWRGADPRVMETFVRDFEIEEPIVLDVNCRCAKNIFETAQKILPVRELGIEKKITAIRESTHPLRVLRCREEDEELTRVVEDLQADRESSGLSWGDFAILYRTHFVGRMWEQALINAGIPCQLAKGQAISDDPIIAQVLASLRVVITPESELYVEHLASKVLDQTLLLEVQRMQGETFSEKLRAYVEEKPGGASRTCWKFLYQVENLKSLRRTKGDITNLVQAIFAQGLGQHENPLEPIVEQMEDPAYSFSAKLIGEKLLRVKEREGRILITPADGLEIPAKIMLQRVLTDVEICYLTNEFPIRCDDLVLVLKAMPLPHEVEKASLILDASRFRITQLFKALQWIESRTYRPIFTEFVCFDTETTGKEIDSCDVIELAAVKVKNGQVVETFHSLVHTDKPIAPEASEVHGYTNADLEGQPTLRDIWDRFAKFAGDHVMIAHNGHRFDVPVLQRGTAEWEGTKNMTFFDTLALARNLYPSESLKQVNLAAKFGIDTGRSHHALDDSRCLAEIFIQLQQVRLIRARKSCLDGLLDCVAIGAAIESRDATHHEDGALIQISTWSDLQRYSRIVDQYSDEAAQIESDVPALDALLERIQGQPVWRGARKRQSPERQASEAQERLSELITSIKATNLEDAVRELLDKVALSTSEGSRVDPDRVNLLTFHATKGLEFPRLYLIGVEDNQFPGWRALERGDENEMRESRRLLYVAMTRAKDKLTLTSCRDRNGKSCGGTMFLDELGLL